MITDVEPVIAGDVVIDSRNGKLTINGQIFPYYIHTDGPTIRAGGLDDLAIVLVPIVVTGDITLIANRE